MQKIVEKIRETGQKMENGNRQKMKLRWFLCYWWIDEIDDRPRPKYIDGKNNNNN